MHKLSLSTFITGVWTLFGGITLLTLGVWLNFYDWQLPSTAYQLFPLFGLLAFSWMWLHYATGAFRRWRQLPAAPLRPFFKATSVAVLVALLLHPALLIWQLWHDGFGLPPASYKVYVGESLVWAVLLGTACFVAFLLYDVLHRFRNAPWWKFVDMASDAAMLGIWLHAFTLGSQLQRGWFKGLWIAYGLTLVGFLGYKYYEKISARTAS